MSKKGGCAKILIAEDDPDDRLLLEKAFEKAGLKNPLAFVENGEDLMDYLHGKGAYAGVKVWSRPDLIFLDLNMPRKSGREALREIKSDKSLCRIPVVVLTTSKAEEDMLKCYEVGASSYITKPVTFEEMVEMLIHFQKYWLEMVELP